MLCFSVSAGAASSDRQPLIMDPEGNPAQAMVIPFPPVVRALPSRASPAAQGASATASATPESIQSVRIFRCAMRHLPSTRRSTSS